jgi:hypothetical protein
MLTANDDPEEDSNDEITDGHRHHNTRNSKVLSACVATGVPEGP